MTVAGDNVGDAGQEPQWPLETTRMEHPALQIVFEVRQNLLLSDDLHSTQVMWCVILRLSDCEYQFKAPKAGTQILDILFRKS